MEQVEKSTLFKNCSDLLLFNCNSDLIFFTNSLISKVFLDHQNIFFFTVGKNNFGNKISFLIKLWINGHGWALQTPNAGRTLVASQAIKPQEKILTDTALVSSPVIFRLVSSTFQKVQILFHSHFDLVGWLLAQFAIII